MSFIARIVKKYLSNRILYLICSFMVDSHWINGLSIILFDMFYDFDFRAQWLILF